MSDQQIERTKLYACVYVRNWIVHFSQQEQKMYYYYYIYVFSDADIKFPLRFITYFVVYKNKHAHISQSITAAECNRGKKVMQQQQRKKKFIEKKKCINNAEHRCIIAK